MEMSIYVGGSLLSMDVSGSFHGSTRKFPQSVEVKDSIASIIGSFYEHIPWKLTCASILPRVSQTSRSFHRTSARVHRFPFDLLIWTFHPTSMDVSVEVNFLPLKSIYFHGGRWKCISFHGNFHGSWWK